MEIREPEICRDDLLFLNDEYFNPHHICIVTGSGTGIGRATAVVAAANKLKTVGLDINEKEGIKTQKIAEKLGGEIIFIKTDLCKDKDIEYAVSEAAKLGEIKYLKTLLP